MNSGFGILYIATGKKYIDEAISSARITQRFAQSVPIVLITDLPSYAVESNYDQVFDAINEHPMPVHSYRDKLVPLLDLPFETTLFLDSDAFLVSPCDDLIIMSELFDLLACYSPVRHPPGWSDSEVPLSFPEINTGVLLFKRSAVIKSLITDWLSLYDLLNLEFNQSWDQASFRSVLWKFICTKALTFHLLPEEFNLRTSKPWSAGRGSSVYVIHGRFSQAELHDFIEYLNADIDTFRTWSIWLSLYPNSSIRPRYDRTFD